jgi:hypothetical protein
MAVPSKSWSTISDAQVDAESPLDETLMTAIRDNLIHLEEWLGLDYTAAQNHDHDGTNSKLLNSTLGEVSNNATVLSSASNLVLPGGVNGFYPQIRASVTATGIQARIAFNHKSTTYATIISIAVSTASTVFAQQKYLQNSPPYLLGEKEWGHFLFQLRDVPSGKTIMAYEAADPPWAYNGPSSHLKDSIERIACIPHPFADYIGHALPADKEIVLIDLSNKGPTDWCKGRKDKGKTLLKDMRRLKLGSITPHSKYKLPTIGRFSTSVVIRKATI